MKLSRDPDTLRIPAFMRKKSIAAKLKRPLVLTALDRKHAALGAKRKPHTAPVKITAKNPKRKTVQPKTPQPKITPSFFAPPMEFSGAPKRGSRGPRAKATKGRGRESDPSPRKVSGEASVRGGNLGFPQIGTLTHYYGKIKVGVIALRKTLEVGDTISYQTADGPYEQIVESMEIDRQPVFKAGKGKEIGLKLRREAKTGSLVSVIS